MNLFIKKVLIFTGIFASLLLIKNILRPYSLGEKKYYSKLKQFKIGEYNTVVFGSSRMYRQLDPALLDSALINYKLSTYNFGLAACFNPESYYLVTNFLDSKEVENVNLILLELQSLNDLSLKNAATVKGSYWNDISMFIFSLKYINNSNYSKEYKRRLKASYFKSFFTHFYDFRYFRNLIDFQKIKVGNGFYPLEQQLKDNPKNKSLVNRHNEFLSDTSNIAIRRLHAKSSYNNETNNFHLNYLKSIIDKANSKNIRVVLVVPPKLADIEYGEVIPMVKSLPKLNVIDLHNSNTFKELYTTENSFDIGHLNTNGAKLFTKYLSYELAKILKEGY